MKKIVKEATELTAEIGQALRRATIEGSPFAEDLSSLYNRALKLQASVSLYKPNPLVDYEAGCCKFCGKPVWWKEKKPHNKDLTYHNCRYDGTKKAKWKVKQESAQTTKIPTISITPEDHMLMKLRVGHDEYSKLRHDKLIQRIPVDELKETQTAAKDFYEDPAHPLLDKFVDVAIRWRLRGLPLSDAIRMSELRSGIIIDGNEKKFMTIKDCDAHPIQALKKMSVEEAFTNPVRGKNE